MASTKLMETKDGKRFFKISVSAPAQGSIPKDEKAAAGL